MTHSDVHHSMRGWLLVGVQAVLFLAVVVAAVAPRVGPGLWSSLGVSLLLVLVGAAGVMASARHLGRALTPLPQPNGQGLAAHGVYRQVRHPMYSALVLICLGVAVGAGSIQVYAAVAALATFFAVKARVEERYLLQTYEGYAAYASVTGRFMPGVGRLRPV